MHKFQESNTETSLPNVLADRLAAWRKTVETELKGAPFEKKLVTRTLDGIALQPVYTRADLGRLSHTAASPGQAPFLRGLRPGGYQAQGWEIAQEIAADTAADFNAAVKSDLMRGQDAVILDAPRLVSDLATLRQALAGVDLSVIPVHVYGGADALSTAALYLAYAAENRFEWTKLNGGITADPLVEWVRAGRLVRGLDRELDSLAGWTRWAADHAPQLRTVSVDGRMWGDAGATAIQELAFALASGAEYLGALRDRGVSIETVARRIEFTFAIGPQFFTEIAKLRAWRLLWTRVIAAHGVAPALAGSMHVRAATSRWNKTLLDPHVNLLRVTTEALSAVLGGVDSLHVSPFDEVTGATNDFSRRIARNVHVLLAEEFGFTRPADPAGGSYYIETLTDELARMAWELFQQIAGRGGFSAALRQGWPQQLLAEAAGEKASAAGKRRLALVGTNLFPNLKETPLTFAPRPAAPKKPKSTVAVPKLARQATWPERFEAALSAARAGATAEQCAQLAGAKSRRGDSIPPVTPFRAAAGFETLRAAADVFARKTGQRPRVFLAKMGAPLQHKARADFSAGFFATGGFEVIAKQSFDSALAAAAAAAASGAAIAVLCSTDETYPELVPAFAAAAKAARPGLKLVLAGLPADPKAVEAFRTAGIDEFIHLRADVSAVLTQFLQDIGAIA